MKSELVLLAGLIFLPLTVLAADWVDVGRFENGDAVSVYLDNKVAKGRIYVYNDMLELSHQAGYLKYWSPQEVKVPSVFREAVLERFRPLGESVEYRPYHPDASQVELVAYWVRVKYAAPRQLSDNDEYAMRAGTYDTAVFFLMEDCMRHMSYGPLQRVFYAPPDARGVANVIYDSGKNFISFMDGFTPYQLQDLKGEEAKVHNFLCEYVKKHG